VGVVTTPAAEEMVEGATKEDEAAADETAAEDAAAEDVAEDPE
jgi:hypothetical protein